MALGRTENGLYLNFTQREGFILMNLSPKDAGFFECVGVREENESHISYDINVLRKKIIL